MCSVVLLGLTEVISWLLYFKLCQCQCRTQTYLRTVKSVWASKNWVQTFQNKVCEKTSGNAFQANPVISNSKNFTDRAPDHGQSSSGPVKYTEDIYTSISKNVWQQCNLTLARRVWATKVCLRASKISQIYLFGRSSGRATF